MIVVNAKTQPPLQTKTSSNVFFVFFFTKMNQMEHKVLKWANTGKI